MKLTPSILVESKAARDGSLLEFGSTERQKNLLCKVKELLFAVWQDTELMTRDQLASFYEVPTSTIDSNYKRNRKEFVLDGVKVHSGKDLRQLKGILPLSEESPKEVLYTPSGALRMGFILRDSEVAKNVRTASIRAIQALPAAVEPQILDAIVTGLPVLSSTVRQGHLEVASPFEAFYKQIERKLKGQYPNGGIHGFSKEDIREKLAALSTYTENLKFNSQKQINFPVGDGERARYPDLTSSPFEVLVDGESRKVVFMLQISDLIVRYKDVEEAVCRRYIETAKEHHQCDYAFLFLVSPFGANPEAKKHIESTIPDDVKGSIGVMTVKQVAHLLRDQAWRERDHGPTKGRINTEFSDILDYDIPEDPYFEGDVIQRDFFNLLS